MSAREWLRANGIETVLCTVIIMLALVISGLLFGCTNDTQAAMLPQDDVVEHANGMPLDAIEYDPPAWIPWCGRAYMVCDRTSGQQWWLLVMENQDMHGHRDASYVVLPIGGEHDAA